MTNYVNELMKATKVEIKDNCLNCPNPCEVACNNCCNRGESYPAFTPAKQLELIKLLFKAIPTKSNPYFEPVKNSDKWQYIHTDLTFEEVLAEMVWNALPVLDKSEVKRILEDDN